MSPRLVALATAGAVGVGVAPSLMTLGLIATGWPNPGDSGGHKAMWAVIATAVYLPLHARHILYWVRGSRPAGVGWTLAAMAVAINGALPLVGLAWLGALSSLALSVLIMIRPPWSLIAFATIMAAPLPLAAAFGSPDYGPYYSAGVASRSLMPLVLIWLLGAIRKLDAARSALAEQALTLERVRIDRELERTLGTALQAISDEAERASKLAARSPVAAEPLLRGLVSSARHTLAEARRLVRGYHLVSLRAELDNAAALLSAAGVPSRLVLPPGDLPEVIDDDARSALRRDIARVLADGTAQSCAIIVTRESGRVRIECRSDQSSEVRVGVAAP